MQNRNSRQAAWRGGLDGVLCQMGTMPDGMGHAKCAHLCGSEAGCTVHIYSVFLLLTDLLLQLAAGILLEE